MWILGDLVKFATSVADLTDNQDKKQINDQ